MEVRKAKMLAENQEAVLLRVRPTKKTKFGNPAITFIFRLLSNQQEVPRTINYTDKFDSEHDINPVLKMMLGEHNTKDCRENQFEACRALEEHAVGEMFDLKLKESNNPKYPLNIVGIKRGSYINRESQVKNQQQVLCVR